MLVSTVKSILNAQANVMVFVTCADTHVRVSVEMGSKSLEMLNKSRRLYRTFVVDIS
eukprot:XP_001705759.1 Hypothetical protein GL50803_28165 [Giardia lamblia ATCC 50803]